MKYLFGMNAWVIGIILIIILFFILVYVLITYSDLDVDLTPTDLARRLQPLVVPEYLIHAFMFGMFLVGKYWIEAIVNFPVFCWNVYSFVTRRHKIDPTRIYYTREFVTKVNTTKLIIFIGCFFLYIFRLIYYFITRSFMDYKEMDYL